MQIFKFYCVCTLQWSDFHEENQRSEMTTHGGHQFGPRIYVDIFSSAKDLTLFHYQFTWACPPPPPPPPLPGVCVYSGWLVGCDYLEHA